MLHSCGKKYISIFEMSKRKKFVTDQIQVFLFLIDVFQVKFTISELNETNLLIYYSYQFSIVPVNAFVAVKSNKFIVL